MVSFKKIENLKPHLAQIVVQVSFAGLYIIARVALINGMNHFVFVTYRMVVATLVIAPFAYIFERKEHPPLTWTLLFHVFLLASGNTIAQNCYFQGVYYTSSTFGSEALNLVPVLTFAMATFLRLILDWESMHNAVSTAGHFARLEKVNMRSSGGQAKVFGTFICVSGAMVMTLYKGPAILSLGTKRHPTTINSKANNVAMGTILVFVSIMILPACLTFQAFVLKRYPAQLSLTTFMCLIGAVESGLLAVICKHNKPNLWAIGWNIELISVLYAGIICSALGMFLQAWCISKKGPVFVAIFSPVATIVTEILELFVLHVDLRVGSVVGTILIAVGLYSALWGKAQDTAN